MYEFTFPHLFFDLVYKMNGDIEVVEMKKYEKHSDYTEIILKLSAELNSVTRNYEELKKKVEEANGNIVIPISNEEIEMNTELHKLIITESCSNNYWYKITVENVNSIKNICDNYKIYDLYYTCASDYNNSTSYFRFYTYNGFLDKYPIFKYSMSKFRYSWYRWKIKTIYFR